MDLGFDASNWAKWAKINVAENMFFKLGIDFIELVPSTSSPNPAKEYAVSIEMAKHLAMMAKHNGRMIIESVDIDTFRALIRTSRILSMHYNSNK